MNFLSRLFYSLTAYFFNIFLLSLLSLISLILSLFPVLSKTAWVPLTFTTLLSSCPCYSREGSLYLFNSFRQVSVFSHSVWTLLAWGTTFNWWAKIIIEEYFPYFKKNQLIHFLDTPPKISPFMVKEYYKVELYQFLVSIYNAFESMMITLKGVLLR